MVIESGYRVTVNSPVTITYNQGLTMRGTASLTAKGDINVSDNPPSRLKISGGTIIANGGTFIAGGQNGQNIVANIIASSIKLGGSPISVTGNLNATGAVTISASSTVNGAIQGGSVTIEADAKVTNGISSTGSINLASRVNVTGAITGTTIVTASAVVIDGSITASTSLLIESASKVTGKLTAPSIQLKSADLVVTGDVKASQTLVIENKATIKGNVEGGNVILGDSDASITGNALVDHITLGYHSRVQQTITCKAYTPSNPCSCVTNNSGWAFNEPMGPKCGPGTQAGPHHFQITHPPSTLTCAAAPVTVTACADASCSSVYTGAAQVTLTPGGATAQINSTQSPTGMVTSSVGQTTAASNVQLGLTSVPATTGALVCKSSLDNSTTNCQMAFLTSALQISGVPRYAEEEGIINISAKQASSSNPNTCVPLFAGQSKTLNLKCTYANPASGTLPARIQGQGGTYVALAANADAGSSCSVAGANIQLAFDANGLATPKMQYADVGALGLIATYASSSGSDSGLTMTGSGTVIVGPKYLAFSAIATPQQAGVAVVPVAPAKDIRVSALNAANAATPNFGRESAAPTVLLGRTVVEPTFIGHAEPSADGSLGFNGGVLTATGMSWKEVGVVQFTASLMNYLGWQLPAVNGDVPPLASGTSGKVQFIPHHFITELIKNKEADQPKVTDGIATPCAAPLTCANDGETGRYAYSGQAIGVRVTARALGETTTQNYDELNPGVLAPVLLEGRDAATGTISFPPSTPDGSSRLTDGSKAQTTVTGVAPAKFTLGIARTMVAYRFPGKAGAPVKVAPTDVLLRASSTYPGGTVVSSSSALIQNEARMTVLSGQWQVAHGYGSELLPVRLAVQVQYWNGTKWITNLLDSISAFNKSQVLFVNCKKLLDCSKLAADDRAYTVVQGALPQANRLTLLAPGTGKAGSVDVSVGNHPYLATTVGVVVFGILRSGPVIYLREMY